MVDSSASDNDRVVCDRLVGICMDRPASHHGDGTTSSGDDIAVGRERRIRTGRSHVDFGVHSSHAALMVCRVKSLGFLCLIAHSPIEISAPWQGCARSGDYDAFRFLDSGLGFAPPLISDVASCFGVVRGVRESLSPSTTPVTHCPRIHVVLRIPPERYPRQLRFTPRPCIAHRRNFQTGYAAGCAMPPGGRR